MFRRLLASDERSDEGSIVLGDKSRRIADGNESRKLARLNESSKANPGNVSPATRSVSYPLDCGRSLGANILRAPWLARLSLDSLHTALGPRDRERRRIRAGATPASQRGIIGAGRATRRHWKTSGEPLREAPGRRRELVKRLTPEFYRKRSPNSRPDQALIDSRVVRQGVATEASQNRESRE